MFDLKRILEVATDRFNYIQYPQRKLLHDYDEPITCARKN